MSSPRLSATVFRRGCLLAVVALAAIVVTGGAVRLSGSGLGCSTWPQCEPGHFSAALAFHPLVEFGNRVVTIGVGLVVAAVAAASLLLGAGRRAVVTLAVGLVAGYLTQAVLGGLTVRFGLSPLLVMAHFGVSLLLLWDAVVLHRRARQYELAAAPLGPAYPVVRPEIVWLGRLLTAIAAVVLGLGTFVSATGPHGGDESSRRLRVLSLHAVAQLHSDAVLLLVGLTVALLFALRLGAAPYRVRRDARALAAVMAGQAALGFVQYALQLPAALVGLHIAGATVFWLLTLRFALGLHDRAADRSARTPPAPLRRSRAVAPAVPTA